MGEATLGRFGIRGCGLLTAQQRTRAPSGTLIGAQPSGGSANFQVPTTPEYVNAIAAPKTAYTLEGWMKLSALKSGTIDAHYDAGCGCS